MLTRMSLTTFRRGYQARFEYGQRAHRRCSRNEFEISYKTHLGNLIVVT